MPESDVWRRWREHIEEPDENEDWYVLQVIQVVAEERNSHTYIHNLPSIWNLNEVIWENICVIYSVIFVKYTV